MRPAPRVRRGQPGTRRRGIGRDALALRLKMRAIATLSIEPTAGGLRFRLDLPDQDLGEPLQEEFRQAIDEATLRALVQSADTLLRLTERDGFADEARARGNVLYRTLVPARLRPQLRALRAPLLITTSLTGLPWELLHDDEEFWGLRYAMGKRLVTGRALPAPRTPSLRARPRALVVAADPRGDLPFARREADAVCEVLEAYADITCVADHVATFDTVSRLLAEGFDLIHFCGHVVTAADGAPALLLAGEQPLSAALIEANVAGRPLVFLNGCASARGGDAPAPAGDWEATVSSVAHGFLFGGAAAVVGTLSDVGDRHAATLAEAFYRRVLEPVSIGEALRAARVACRDDRDSVRSPAWLSFVLYGNPGQVLLRTTTPAPTAIQAPAVVAAPVPAVTAEPPAPRSRARAWRIALVAVAIFLMAGIAQMLRPTIPAPMVVGVMEVRGRGAPEWMRELTRDGLNTILSKFAPIKVFSRQKIDFVREKRGISEIEAAESLGMSKMLTATVSVDRGEVLLELEVVDIDTGLLEGWERVRGPEDQLMALQTDLAVRALRILGIDPTPAQVDSIMASRGNETLSAYRLLAETLGEPAPPEPPPAPAPTDGGSDRAPGTSWLRFGSLAWALEPDQEEDAIRALLGRYGVALESKSVEQLATLQVEMTAAQRTSLQRYFDQAGDLKVRILDVDVLIEGDEALATFTREDAFTDTGSQRPMHLEVRITGVMRKADGAWKIAGLRNPK